MKNEKQEKAIFLKKYPFLLLMIVGIIFSVTGCFTGESIDTVANDSDGITPNHWYHYSPLPMVNFQNCMVSDAVIRNAGGVFVTYYPVCMECHDVGTIGTAIVSEEESYMKTHYCDCGELTGVIIKIII